jgi:hypothetical protein
MSDSKGPDASGCFGCLFGLGLLTGMVYWALTLLGVAVPWWMIAADVVCFLLGGIFLTVLVFARGPGEDKTNEPGEKGPPRKG